MLKKKKIKQNRVDVGITRTFLRNQRFFFSSFRSSLSRRNDIYCDFYLGHTFVLRCSDIYLYIRTDRSNNAWRSQYRPNIQQQISIFRESGQISPKRVRITSGGNPRRHGRDHPGAIAVSGDGRAHGTIDLRDVAHIDSVTKENRQVTISVPGLHNALLIQSYSRCRYRELDENHQLVQWLWNILESFSDAERVLFMRFVSGRSRLPSNLADLSQRFQVGFSRFFRIFFFFL